MVGTQLNCGTVARSSHAREKPFDEAIENLKDAVALCWNIKRKKYKLKKYNFFCKSTYDSMREMRT